MVHPPNLWLMITAEDQDHYGQRWPILSEVPAVVRGMSYEPALRPAVPHVLDELWS